MKCRGRIPVAFALVALFMLPSSVPSAPPSDGAASRMKVQVPRPEGLTENVALRPDIQIGVVSHTFGSAKCRKVKWLMRNKGARPIPDSAYTKDPATGVKIRISRLNSPQHTWDVWLVDVDPLKKCQAANQTNFDNYPIYANGDTSGFDIGDAYGVQCTTDVGLLGKFSVEADITKVLPEPPGAGEDNNRFEKTLPCNCP